MSTQGDICFFTSTGNSLAIARELADALSCMLVPMGVDPAPDTLTPGGERLGFVFPVYHASYGRSGIPHIVQEFIRKVGDLSGRDIFLVCTHSGSPGDTVASARKLIEANLGSLRVGMPVQMSVPRSPWQKLAYTITKRPLGPIRGGEEKQRALYEDWRRRKADLLRDLAGDVVSVEALGGMKKRVWQGLADVQQGLVLKRYQQLAESTSGDLEELFRASDRSFRLDGRCNGCGTCARVCPVSNITLADGPVWNHRCELCYACYQWCPRGAIGGEIVEFEQRDHHPDVSLRDMLRR